MRVSSLISIPPQPPFKDAQPFSVGRFYLRNPSCPLGREAYSKAPFRLFLSMG
jgi:hypothetical protein